MICNPLYLYILNLIYNITNQPNVRSLRFKMSSTIYILTTYPGPLSKRLKDNIQISLAMFPPVSCGRSFTTALRLLSAVHFQPLIPRIDVLIKQQLHYSILTVLGRISMITLIRLNISILIEEQSSPSTIQSYSSLELDVGIPSCRAAASPQPHDRPSGVWP
jgi:hypothetical protein